MEIATQADLHQVVESLTPEQIEWMEQQLTAHREEIAELFISFSEQSGISFMGLEGGLLFAYIASLLVVGGVSALAAHESNRYTAITLLFFLIIAIVAYLLEAPPALWGYPAIGVLGLLLGYAGEEDEGGERDI